MQVETDFEETVQEVWSQNRGHIWEAEAGEKMASLRTAEAM